MVAGRATASAISTGKRFVGYFFHPSQQRLLIALAVCVVALLILLPHFIRIKTTSPEAEAKQNLYAIQLALERYAVDHNGWYPGSLSELRSQEYMREFPENAYPGLHGVRRPMREVRFAAPGGEGDFTYLTFGEATSPHHYTLLVYGTEQDTGEDADGDGVGDRVLLVLRSGGGKHIPQPGEPPLTEPPALAEWIRLSRDGNLPD